MMTTPAAETHPEPEITDPANIKSAIHEPSATDPTQAYPEPVQSAPAVPEHADIAADSMKDQLRRDVASWREGRSESSSRGATDLSVAVARSIVPPTTARMKRAKPTVADVKPATAEKKPFGMSYDGTSRSDYIKLMISRGAR